MLKIYVWLLLRNICMHPSVKINLSNNLMIVLDNSKTNITS